MSRDTCQLCRELRHPQLHHTSQDRLRLQASGAKTFVVLVTLCHPVSRSRSNILEPDSRKRWVEPTGAHRLGGIGSMASCESQMNTPTDGATGMKRNSN